MLAVVTPNNGNTNKEGRLGRPTNAICPINGMRVNDEFGALGKHEIYINYSWMRAILTRGVG
jgi:hypothetical protein